MHIFLSRPTWVSDEFTSGLEVFLTGLKNLGVTPRTLGTTDYPSKAPLDEVIDIMAECKGAVILGYPQISIIQGSVKSSELKDTLHLPTEWNHIEAALAYAKGLPLLSVHHSSVSRGVFDRGVMNAFAHSVDMSQPTWSMDKGFNGALTKWKDDCFKGKSNFPIQTAVELSDPQCPNCSTAQKAIYMSALPQSMKHIGSWLCHSCNYTKK